MSISGNSMGDDFHAVLKLVSGEEIYAQASWIEEDQLLLVGNAITIKEDVLNPQPGVMHHVLVPNMWMKFSGEDTFVIEKHKIITISELDDNAIEFYGECLQKALAAQKQFVSGNKTRTENNKGYVSKVDDARMLLEKLYRIKPKS